MSSLDFSIFAVAFLIALITLIRLMKNRHRQLVVEIRNQLHSKRRKFADELQDSADDEPLQKAV